MPPAPLGCLSSPPATRRLPCRLPAISSPPAMLPATPRPRRGAARLSRSASPCWTGSFGTAGCLTPTAAEAAAEAAAEGVCSWRPPTTASRRWCCAPRASSPFRSQTISRPSSTRTHFAASPRPPRRETAAGKAAGAGAGSSLLAPSLGACRSTSSCACWTGAPPWSWQLRAASGSFSPARGTPTFSRASRACAFSSLTRPTAWRSR